MTFATVYEWPLFRLVFDPAGETVVTHYADGTWTGGSVVPDDAYHAARLGLSPLQHRLQHELAHHLVQRARGAEIDGSCRILWRDAHHEPQVQPEAGTDEWYITAVQYVARDAVLPSAGHYGALLDLHQAGVDVPALAAKLRWLMDAPQHAARVTLTPGRRAVLWESTP